MRKYYNKFDVAEVIVLDNNITDNWTDVEPIGYQYYPQIPKQKFISKTKKWKLLDDCPERAKLDATTRLESLKIGRAMRQLPSSTGDKDKTAEDDLYALFEQYPKFRNEWVISPYNFIDLEDDAVKEALKFIQVDVDEIKRVILNIRAEVNTNGKKTKPVN